MTRTPSRARSCASWRDAVERYLPAAFAATGATLALHLSIHVVDQLVPELIPFYGAECPAAVVFRATWPDEQVLTGTLATIAGSVAEAKLERTALILVGPALKPVGFSESALYSTGYDRRFRPGFGDSAQGGEA